MDHQQKVSTIVVVLSVTAAFFFCVSGAYEAHSENVEEARGDEEETASLDHMIVLSVRHHPKRCCNDTRAYKGRCCYRPDTAEKRRHCCYELKPHFVAILVLLTIFVTAAIPLVAYFIYWRKILCFKPPRPRTAISPVVVATQTGQGAAKKLRISQVSLNVEASPAAENKEVPPHPV